MGQIGIILIIVGVLGIIKNKKNNILILLSLELFFIGIALLFIHTAFILDDFEGIAIAILILCISAIESTIGLTILLVNRKYIS